MKTQIDKHFNVSSEALLVEYVVRLAFSQIRPEALSVVLYISIREVSQIL